MISNNEAFNISDTSVFEAMKAAGFEVKFSPCDSNELRGNDVIGDLSVIEATAGIIKEMENDCDVISAKYTVIIIEDDVDLCVDVMKKDISKTFADHKNAAEYFKNVCETFRKNKMIVTTNVCLIKAFGVEEIANENAKVLKEFYSLIDNDEKRFIVINMNLSIFGAAYGHANTIVVDKRLKKLHHFEPHGLNKYTSDTYDELYKDFGYSKIKLSLSSSFKVNPIGKSPQGNDGYCQSWSLMFALLYMWNIDKVEELMHWILNTDNQLPLLGHFQNYVYCNFSNVIKLGKKQRLENIIRKLDNKREVLQKMRIQLLHMREKDKGRCYRLLYKIVSALCHFKFDSSDRFEVDAMRIQYIAFIDTANAIINNIKKGEIDCAYYYFKLMLVKVFDCKAMMMDDELCEASIYVSQHIMSVRSQ